MRERRKDRERKKERFRDIKRKIKREKYIEKTRLCNKENKKLSKSMPLSIKFSKSLKKILHISN